MLLDLDRFKAVNDTWGHAAGDAVLVEVARRLRETLRPADLLARMGGEEFLVALPEVTEAAARAMAERLRRAVGCAPVALPGGEGPVRVTVSIGLVLAGAGALAAQPAAAAIEAADRALLAAKADGRNQVTVGLSAA
jgi:two-component system cell cycle response regulator